MDISEVEHMTRGYRERTIVTFAICYSLATTAVGLRFLSRKLANNDFWWDDWLAVLGLCMTAGFCGCVISCLQNDAILDGEKPIDTDLLIHGAKGAYVAEMFYYLNQVSLKASILFFYWRVFSSSSYIRIGIKIMAVYIVLWFIASFIASVLQCVPVQANWDPVAKLDPDVKCLDLNGFFFGTSIPNITADFILVTLPIPQVLQLKITTTQKAFLIFFFVLGGFVVITSIIRLKLILDVNFATFAVNWSTDDSVLWTIVENCCGIIGICLPSMRPIVKLMPWRVIQSAFSRSYSGSQGTRSRGNTGGSNIFNKNSRHRAPWSEIGSTNGGPVESSGIRKETHFDVVSIEMNPPLKSSSQTRIVGESSGDEEYNRS